MTRILTISISLILYMTAPVEGQSYEHERNTGQISFLWTLPETDLTDNLETAPMGLSISFGGQVPGMPFILMTELGLLNYGFTETLDLQHLENVAVSIVSAGTSHNIGMGHLVVRFQPQIGPVQPYVDVLGGVKALVTKTTIDGDVLFSDTGFSGTSRISDRAFSYGAGAGLDLKLYEGQAGYDGRKPEVSLNLGVRYLLGTPANYIVNGSLAEVDDSFAFETRRSNTDLITPQIGVRIGM